MKKEEGMKEVPFSQIVEGMVLSEKMYTKGKKLLFTKGTILTAPVIERLKNFHRIDPIVDRVRIEKIVKEK